MQVVIFCGGRGMRLNEYTQDIPKPLIEIGGQPILHHLMSWYAHHGFTDFILCLGYKGELIEQHFADHHKDWTVKCVHTGEDATKAQRLLKIKEHIKNDTFLASYGDDLCTVPITELVEFHKEKGKTVTLTAVPLKSPFGVLELDEHNTVTSFKEKPTLNHQINGGFYVMNTSIFDHIDAEDDLEVEVFNKLAEQQEIAAFSFDGFWKSINTLKDVIELNDMVKENNTPWTK